MTARGRLAVFAAAVALAAGAGALVGVVVPQVHDDPAGAHAPTVTDGGPAPAPAHAPEGGR